MFNEIQSSHRDKIIELFEELIDVYKDNDWLVIKKYILRYSHPTIRKYFSTRNEKTLKQSLNSFEISFIKFCQDNYGLELILAEEDTHYEENQEDS